MTTPRVDPRLEDVANDYPWVQNTHFPRICQSSVQVSLPEGSTIDWSDAEIIQYFESDGVEYPGAPPESGNVDQELAGPTFHGTDLKTDLSHVGDPENCMVSIGDVSLVVRDPKHPGLVPCIRQPTASRQELSVLRWMFQKFQLGQDMFLIGSAGSRPRRCAMLCCALLRREVV